MSHMVVYLCRQCAPVLLCSISSSLHSHTHAVCIPGISVPTYCPRLKTSACRLQMYPPSYYAPHLPSPLHSLTAVFLFSASSCRWVPPIPIFHEEDTHRVRSRGMRRHKEPSKSSPFCLPPCRHFMLPSVTNRINSCLTLPVAASANPR